MEDGKSSTYILRINDGTKIAQYATAFHGRLNLENAYETLRSNIMVLSGLNRLGNPEAARCIIHRPNIRHACNINLQYGFNGIYDRLSKPLRKWGVAQLNQN